MNKLINYTIIRCSENHKQVDYTWEPSQVFQEENNDKNNKEPESYALQALSIFGKYNRFDERYNLEMDHYHEPYNIQGHQGLATYGQEDNHEEQGTASHQESHNEEMVDQNILNNQQEEQHISQQDEEDHIIKVEHHNDRNSIAKNTLNPEDIDKACKDLNVNDSDNIGKRYFTRSQIKDPIVKKKPKDEEYNYSDYEIFHKLSAISENIKKQHDAFTKDNIINLKCGTYRLKDVLGRDGRFLQCILFRTKSEKKNSDILDFLKKKKLSRNLASLRSCLRSKLVARADSRTKTRQYDILNLFTEQSGYDEIMSKTITISPVHIKDGIKYKYIDKDNKETIVYISEKDVKEFNNIVKHSRNTIDILIKDINEFIHENKDIKKEYMKELFDFITIDYNGYDIYDEEIENAINQEQQQYDVLQILSDIYKEIDEIDKIDDIPKKEEKLDELRTYKFMKLITPICYFPYNSSKLSKSIKELFTNNNYDQELVQELFMEIFLLPIKEYRKEIINLTHTKRWKSLKKIKVKFTLLKVTVKTLYTKFFSFIEKYPNNIEAKKVIQYISSALTKPQKQKKRTMKEQAKKNKISRCWPQVYCCKT